jgi:hypothetical protein
VLSQISEGELRAACAQWRGEGWEVLDVANRRFFTLSSDFLTEYVEREGIAPASHAKYAVGCANSILICSVTGWSVAFDLSKKAWDQYPRNKLWKAVKMYGVYREVCGSNYCLSLCAL